MNTKMVLIFLLTLILDLNLKAETFNFSSDKNQWSFYGDGIGAYDYENGNKSSNGSLWLNTDYGESKTVFYKWSGLSPGSYKVSFYVKSKNVLKTKDETSLWHFYDSGDGTRDIFRDLNGSYDWRKVEYTINVPKGDLTIWFRLVTPGQIWVDDFEIIKDSTKTRTSPVKIGPAVPAKSTLKKDIALKPKTQKESLLYSFDKDEYGHPFVRRSDRGEFLTQEFYDFKIQNLPIKNWSDYDRLEMEVFNPNDSYVEFFATLADDKGQDYWSQLNHKQSLAPGWNKLNFSLTQYVGERGSHRFLRSLDLSKLKKFYIVIDPDKKHNYPKKRFLIDNIKLSSHLSPVVPKDVYFFNFTTVKSPEISNYKKVTAQDSYSLGAAFGFIDPTFWRVEDSVYASEVERYTIGLLAGKFRVALPNGSYKIRLVIDKLGYWDVPFWSDRMIYANGAPIYKSIRSSAQDFLKDVLRFEEVVPGIQDNPYSLYLSRVFETIEKDVVVKNGFLDLEFAGDASAISLNHLMVYSNNAQKQALKFSGDLKKRNELEFSWMSRSIDTGIEKSAKNVKDVALVDTSLRLSPVGIADVSADKIIWSAGKSEQISQMIQIKAQDSADSLIWKISDLKGPKAQISSKDISMSKLIYQYTSPDLNHESYLIAGKYLVPLEGNKADLNKKQNEYFYLSYKVPKDQAPGLYKGDLSLKVGNKTHSIGIELLVSNYSLAPQISFPVGFFGLDPLPHTYFPNKQYGGLRHEYRMLALKKLLEAGFTTFTGLPSDVKELEEIFTLTNKYQVKKVYSYGGEFPKNFMDASEVSEPKKKVEFYQQKSSELKSLLATRKWPSIVYTFSDEASGYSDKIDEDLKIARELKTYFPYMKIGGFSSFHTAKVVDLNLLFDEAFYFHLPKKYENQVKKSKQNWGFYNGSPGNLDDPRFSFGLGLFVAREQGLSHYLEWHASAVQNYPYYDFDGRESDVVMFYPKSNRTLMNALRFELAVEGLQTFKKLSLLKALINKKPQVAVSQKAKSWLSSIESELNIYSDNNFMHNKNYQIKEFNKALQSHLEKLSALE